MEYKSKSREATVLEVLMTFQHQNIQLSLRKMAAAVSALGHPISHVGVKDCLEKPRTKEEAVRIFGELDLINKDTGLPWE